MTRLIQLAIVGLLFSLLQPLTAFGQDESHKKIPWKGLLADETEITDSALEKILEKHVAWIIYNGSHGKKADLSKVFFPRVDLSNSNLYQAVMSRAYLIEANLKGAWLREVDLSNARLERADLSDTNLDGSDLSNANLFQANLSSARLNKAKLNSTIFVGADLSNVMFNKADLSNANLAMADMSNAVLWQSNLTGCNMRDARGFPLPKRGSGKSSKNSLPVYEPMVGSVPDIPSMVGLPNL